MYTTNSQEPASSRPYTPTLRAKHRSKVEPIDASSPVRFDNPIYPAAYTILELGRPPLAPSPATVSLSTVVRRATQIVVHAMGVGDNATAQLMAEAFARLALHSPRLTDSHRPEPLSNRERTVLQDIAVTLACCAYPDASEHHQRTASAFSVNPASHSNLAGRIEHSAVDKELDELWDRLTASEEAVR